MISEFKKRNVFLTLVLSVLLLSAGHYNLSYAATAKEFVNECNQKIALLEKDAVSASDLHTQAELYKQAADVGFSCLFEGIKNYVDNTVFPGFGKDAFHETSNYLNYCETTISAKEEQTNYIADPMSRFESLQDLLQFTFGCLRTFTGEMFDPRIAPGIGSDELRESTNLNRFCTSIINDLKNQYDPLSCEAGDVVDRDRLVKNLKTVESWCVRQGNSDMIDPSYAPSIGSDPYGTEDMYSHPVCGIVPDAVREPEPDKQSVTDAVSDTAVGSIDCLSIINSVSQNDSWSAQKRFLSEKDGDYCLVTNSRAADRYAGLLPGAIKVGKETLKITYGSKGVDDAVFDRLNSGFVNADNTYKIGDNRSTLVRKIGIICIAELTTEYFVPPRDPDNPYHQGTEEEYVKSYMNISLIGSWYEGLGTLMSGICSGLITDPEEYEQSQADNYLEALVTITPAAKDISGVTAVEPEFAFQLMPKFSFISSDEGITITEIKIWNADESGATFTFKDDSGERQATASTFSDFIVVDDGLSYIYGHPSFEVAVPENTDGQPLVIELSSPGSIGLKTNAGIEFSPGTTANLQNLVTLDVDATADTGITAESVRDVLNDENYQSGYGSGDIKVVEVSGGSLRVVAGNSAEDTKTADKEYTPSISNIIPVSPEGIATIDLDTDYAFAYDPETRATVVEVYDGTVDIWNLKTGIKLATLTSSYGSEIKHAEISAEGIITEKIAIPQSEWRDFVKNQNKGGGGFVWLIIFLAVAAGGGYLLYRKGIL